MTPTLPPVWNLVSLHKAVINNRLEQMLSGDSVVLLFIIQIKLSVGENSTFHLCGNQRFRSRQLWLHAMLCLGGLSCWPVALYKHTLL